MSTLTTTAVLYHMASMNGTEATEWVQGQARKGVADQQRAVGLILFDQDAIDADLNGATLKGAKLALTRDATYGTGNADLSIAPVSMDSVSGAMTNQQCLDLAIRKLHHVAATEGTTAAIDLPGAWLRALSEGLINGFMLYTEAGEGTDTYMQFDGTAYLMLDTTSVYVAPVWTRPVGEGDIISDSIRSHVWDLKELEYYLNIRRAIRPTPLTPVDLELGDSELYSNWYGLIGTLRTKTNEVIEDEGGTAMEWCVITQDMLPKAEAINELRLAMEQMVGTAERLSVTTYGRVSFENVNKDFTVNRNTTVNWAKKAPMSGMNWGYEIRNEVKVKVYNRRFGFWLFRDKMVNKVVTSAKLRVTRSSGRSGSWPVVLYPIKVSAVPKGKMSVNQVFATTACGRANCAVGQTVDIPLSDDVISKIQAGTYYGVGVDDHEDWTNFSGSAVLILNE